MSLNHIYQIKDRERILSPALIFYPELIKRNIQRMIKIAGSTKRLRPHIKTFKCKEIVQLQMEAGIRHFKCASLEEARLLAELKIPDALVAYPLTGPAQLEFLNLSNTFQDTQFSVLIDHEDQVQQWKRYTDASISVFIDLDVGMHRTGIDPNSAMALYDSLDSRFNFRGFHVYDGHIHTSSLEVRTQEVEAAFTKVIPLLASFESKQALEIICGGSASFPIHAQDPMRTVSPGTTLLWDQGYTSSFPDLPLEIAAVCLCRVISKPQPDLLCVDLGHKAVASEMKEMPVHFQQIPDAQMASISEEHLVLRTDAASKFKIGDVLYGFPWHICPTVALHESALIIEDQTIQEQWMISARKRKYLL